MVKRCSVEVNFHGGDITSNVGVLLLRQVDKRLGLSEAVSKALRDLRRKTSCKHDGSSYSSRTIHKNPVLMTAWTIVTPLQWFICIHLCQTHLTCLHAFSPDASHPGSLPEQLRSDLNPVPENRARGACPHPTYSMWLLRPVFLLIGIGFCAK